MTYNWDTKEFDKPTWHPAFFPDEVADVPQLESWPTIGNSETPVTGKINLNGAGHTIYGLFIKDSVSGNQGLFGKIGGTADININNLKLEKSFVYSSKEYISVLLGYAGEGAIVSLDKCEINNCIVLSIMSSGSKNYAGGLVGYDMKSTMELERCTVKNSNVIGSGTRIGILAGYTNVATISNCNVINCNLMITGTRAGGIVGYAKNTDIMDSSVEDCNLQTSGGISGGLFGIAEGTITIKTCNVLNCDIVASNKGVQMGGLIGQIGGIVSVLDSSAVNCDIVSNGGSLMGGLIGLASSGTTTVSNCITVGDINGEYNVGSFVGQLRENSQINNCMAIGDISGKYNVGGFVGNQAGSSQITNCIAIGDITGLTGNYNIGGFVGILSETSQMSNCVALNEYISSTPSKSGRVAGSLASSDSLSKCYAWDGMKINGELISSDESDKNGKQASSGLIWDNQDFFENTLGWNFKETWVMSDAENFKLPILQGIDVPSYDVSYLKPVTVTFDTQGGSEVDPQKITNGFKATRPANNPTKTGYAFGDWYKETACTNLFNFDAAVTADVVTAYAKWTANTYTVTFNNNTGVGSTPSVTATYGEAMPSISSFPTKIGYTFDGYFAEKSGGTQYYNKDGSSAWTWNIAKAATLYAHWIANQTTVTLDAQGGTSGSDSVKATYDAAMPSVTIPTKTGYTFTGYFDDAAPVKQYYKADGTSKASWDKDVATATLYANWTANTYEVKFDKNTGDTDANPKSIDETYDGKYVLPTTLPTKAGYDFAGWYTAADGGSQVTESTDVKTASKHTLYAHWKAIPYDIEVKDHVADFSTKGLPVVKVDVGKNGITKVNFLFKGKPAEIKNKPAGFKSITPIKDEFDLSIIIKGEQTGDVIVFFTAGNSGHYFLAHKKGDVWEFLKAVATEVAGQYKAVVTKESGFSPFQIVSAEPEDVPQSSSSSRDYGASIWLPATAEPTAAPTPAAEHTQAVPTASPVKPTPQASSPAPIAGLLAGLGAAAVFFGLRRR